MNNIYKLVSEKIINSLSNKLTGAENEIIYEMPENSIFLGAFYDENAEQRAGVEFPNSLGIAFSISKSKLQNNSNLNISFSCDFYYRMNPTYEEQIEYLINKFKENSNINKDDEISFLNVIHNLFKNYLEKSRLFAEYDKGNQDKYLSYLNQMILDEISIPKYIDLLKTGVALGVEVNSLIESFLESNLTKFEIVDKKTILAPKYKRVSVKDIKPFIFDLNHIEELDEIVSKYKIEYNNTIRDYAIQTKNDILSISKILRVQDVISPENYELLKNNYTEIMTPNWEIDFNIDISEYDGELIIDVELTNKNKTQEDQYFGKYRYPYSVKMYNANILVKTSFESFKTCENVFTQIKINDLAESYRYNVEKYSSGLNCNTIHVIKDDECILQTVNISKYEEKRRVTRIHNDISLKFIDYVNNPIFQLKTILTKMNEEKEELKDYIKRFKDGSLYYQAALNDVKEFEREIRRFEFGIECLEAKSMALKAFKYLNETFHRNSKKFDSWRLFQLIFIVSNIPDMLVGEFGEDDLHMIRNYAVTGLVDILYFSTGGGKTEAFLGCVIFSLFFDRLRGKSMGVTAIVKYPLRLLSIQQLDRFASKLATANQVKEEHGIPGKLFSLGYYVGSGNTLNQVDNYSELKEEIEYDADKYKFLHTCPNCGADVSLEVDENKKFILHKCNNSQCLYHQVIPFLFIDSEIYRNPSSVIISTLDKFAIMAYNKDFRDLFLLKNEEIKDPIPTLVITDEIHLIKESLGTFSSHYESIFNFYCSELISDLGKKNKKIKYMGATATISNYKHQSKELYMQDATLFPALSPNIKKDFYSEVDDEDIARINIGMLPFGTSPVTYILQMIKIYRELVADMIEHVGNYFSNEINCGINTNEILKALYDYYIMIQYNNTKRDASRVRGGIDSYVNNTLNVDEKYKVSSNTILTGDTAFSDVKDILSKIENCQNPILDDVPDYITATSMISHGVDNEKFNAIFFLGMPNLFAEYIQAYSRVGRHITGFVFNIIRSRVREKSFLSNFNEYLEYKELLVSPIPISRYSIGALKKTFNGILLSLLNIYYSPKYGGKVHTYMDFKNMLLEIGEKPLDKTLKRIYSHDENEGKLFNEKINELIHETFTYIRDSSNDTYIRIHYVIYKVNSSESRPMRSLRDTDSPVLIELKGGE